MKAFVLAAGLGSRLYPLTAEVPKCLVPVGGRALLEIWLEALSKAGVDEVLLNTHYLAPKVWEFAETWRGKPALTIAHETRLLGSAGTILHNWDFVEGQESFLVCYADNFTDLDIRSFVAFHDTHEGPLSIVLFRSGNPQECGVVEIGPGGRLLSFEEKPAVPRSSLASGGVYMMRAAVRARLPERVPSDLGRDFLPRCFGAAYGWLWNGFLIDIGTPAGYLRAQAQQAWLNAGVSTT